MCVPSRTPHKSLRHIRSTGHARCVPTVPGLPVSPYKGFVDNCLCSHLRQFAFLSVLDLFAHGLEVPLHSVNLLWKNVINDFCVDCKRLEARNRIEQFTASGIDFVAYDARTQRSRPDGWAAGPGRWFEDHVAALHIEES